MSRIIAASISPMIGSSPAFQDIRRRAAACTRHDAPIFLQGESGSGKKSLARDIHAASGGAEAAFVALNCGSLDQRLFDRIFSDAGPDVLPESLRIDPRGGPGAAICTVFLAEIEALDRSRQAQLLKMLTSARASLSMRVIAANEQDLFTLVRDGRFRMDLYQCLSRVMLTLPPLRARGNDAVELARHFVKNRDFRTAVDKSLEPAALVAIRAYPWPGNVRELRNVVERAIILSGDQTVIEERHLGLEIGAGTEQDGPIRFSFLHFPTIDELQRHYISILLGRKDFSRARIASTLNISERTVYRILRDLQPGHGERSAGQ